MRKPLALCCLLLTLALGACTQGPSSGGSSSTQGAATAVGSEVARPGPKQAGVIGR